MVTMGRTESRRAHGGSMRERAGRALLGAVSAALLLSGAYLLVNAAPDESDLRRSGIDWEALVASRPAVAIYLERLLRLAAVATAGLGAMGLLAVLAMRAEGRRALLTVWALPATTLGITAVLAAEGTPIAWLYAGLTLLGAAGLILARPRKEEA